MVGLGEAADHRVRFLTSLGRGLGMSLWAEAVGRLQMKVMLREAHAYVSLCSLKVGSL